MAEIVGGSSSNFSLIKFICVFSLNKLMSSGVSIYFPPWRFFGGGTAESIRFPSSIIQALIIIQYFGFSLVRHCRMILLSSGGTPDRN